MVRRIRLDAAKTIQEGEDQFLMRKQAESQLIKLSLAVEQSSCSVIIADTKGCIEYVNPKVTQITGYTKEELIGKHPHIFKSNKTPREQYAHLWNTIKSGSEWRGEFLNKKKSGELYWEETVHNLTGGADEVTAASGQISASSQSLAEGSSHQASSLEETSASIEEMSSVTARNADNARAANQLAIKTKNSAEYGNQALESLQATMEELNAGNGKVLAIIKSIDDIAFQTNLLALNAAVEAARAGEHGRGFAVVAQEVRNLAQRCSTASKETTELIHSRVERTENAAKIAGKCAETLKEIVEEAKKVTDLAGEISVSSQEQAEGISQISTAVSSIDTVTQQNAANAEELAAASEQLSAQADSLKAIVKELAVSMGIVEEYNASRHVHTDLPKKALKTFLIK